MSLAQAVDDYESVFVRYQENERLRTTANALGVRSDTPFIFVCECSEPSCLANVRLTLAEFDVRRNANNSIVAPGH